MIKRSQFSMFGGALAPSLPTLEDLFIAVRADPTLGPFEKAQLVNQIKGVTGFADGNTSLSALMQRGLSGVAGMLISKYFGMSPVGQLMSTIAGVGLGSSLYEHFNQPANNGWEAMR